MLILYRAVRVYHWQYGTLSFPCYLHNPELVHFVISNALAHSHAHHIIEKYLFVSIYVYSKGWENKQETLLDEADKIRAIKQCFLFHWNRTSCKSCFIKVQLLWCSSFSSLQSFQYRGKKKKEILPLHTFLHLHLIYPWCRPETRKMSRMPKCVK